jgi:uncharacterized protein (UPF0216 family)
MQGDSEKGRNMPEINEADIIWIQDAEKAYSRNRRTLDALIDERRLSVVAIPGDRKIYLLRKELDALFKPRIIQPAKHQDVG